MPEEKHSRALLDYSRQYIGVICITRPSIVKYLGFSYYLTGPNRIAEGAYGFEPK